MKTTLYFLLIVTQLVTITYLSVTVINKKSKTQGVSINRIDANTIQKNMQSHYRYFYEPKQDIASKTNGWGPNNPTYTINSDTLNDRFDYLEKKEGGVFRIITLGDSYTYGLYVDTKDNWTEILEVNLNANNNCPAIRKLEVINLAVHGYDIGYSLERYRKRGIKYDPDLILWFIIEPYRLTENIHEKMEKNKKNWIKEGLRTDSYDFWSRAFEEVQKEFKHEHMNEYQLGILKQINSLYDGNLVFMNQRGDEKASEFTYLYDFVQTRRDTFIHSTVSIRNDATLHFPTDSHPNIKGHKAIANDIEDYLTHNAIIPCTVRTSR